MTVSSVTQSFSTHTRLLRLVSLLLPLLSSGCGLLLGPDPKPVEQFTAHWEKMIVTSGEISGLDLAISEQGEILASYIHEGANIRVSRFSGGAWTHLDGPSVSGGSFTRKTHIAAGPGGNAALMFFSGSDMHVLPISTTFGNDLALSTLEVTRRDTLFPRPGEWAYESAGLAYGADGRIRAVVRGTAEERLWLFRQEDSGWSLGVVPNSHHVLGTIDLAVSGNGHEHIVFQANSQGLYYWWRPGKGWNERLKIPDSLPYLLRLRADELSVLATRDRFTIHVAEEVYDAVQERCFWLIRTVVEDDLLFWHNLDLVLDENGLPSLIYILYQDWDEQYQLWFTRFESDGTWTRALVASNLRLPYFSPFNVRLAQEASGRMHILLNTGEVVGVSGVGQQHEYQLLHLYSDNPLGNP